MSLNRIFATRLKTARTKKNITQEQLADLLGVSRQAVSKWENGSGYPEVEKLVLLARELTVSLDDLFALTGVSHVGEAEQAAQPPHQHVHVIRPLDRIAISSFDKKKLLLCYDVRATRALGSGKIQYALLGVTRKGFWERKEEIIGWYLDIDSVEKEINAIHTAMIAGESNYELRFFAPVELKGLFGSPQIIEDSDQ
ncbi:helix-turn-helix transcriptional regulator [Arcanobacterium phocisimile]|uniref:Helix-turn-helix transcriptional regulator n=1 Tax=Arcanobacterium phocisimile TaxID=1302235 RepID=A0ABX7IEH1_9ACTO|nr:helix-turn-helix transcriptional regulator [Arcanobacterium phocisimile]QRV01534.1 helix-turn-helix transcriptional regulator [Arcanobacterium phocisimile]